MKRILHIDDEEAIRTLISALAERLLGIPYTCDTSQRADELVPLLTRARDEQRPYDAVILDDTTDGTMRGLDALSKARLSGYTTPIIIHASIRDMTPDNARVYIEKMNATFVPKPFTRNAIEKLRDILNLQESS